MDAKVRGRNANNAQQNWVKGTVDTTQKRTSMTIQDSWSIIGLIAETVLAYLFWNIFIELMPNIWFIPMDVMSVTNGEEFTYLIAYLFPVLLKIRFLRESIAKHPTVFHILALVGLASPFTTTLRGKIISTFFGTGLGILVQFSNLWRGEKHAERAVNAHLIALIAFVSSRFAFSSMIPIWFNETCTIAAIVVGVVAAIVLGFDKDFVHYESPERNASLSTDLRYGTSFGVLLFLTHWIMTSHGLLPRWIDVDPFIGGIGIIASMTVGILISNYQPLVRSWVWWFVGTVSAALIISPFFTPYQTMNFGYIVVTFLSSVWYPSIVDITRNSNMVRTLLVGFVLYIFLQLALIWSVAYCFVPEGTGGPFMRERAYQVFVILLVFMGMAYNSYSYRSDRPHRLYPRREVVITLVLVLLCVTAPAVFKRQQSWHDYSGYEGIPKDVVRGMVWAIRFGYNNEGFQNFRDVADQIRKVGANVVSLVETDMQRPFNRNQDLVEYLEENLHMYSDYGPSTMNETWGCALLSYWPIVRSDREVLPSPEGENACLIDATLNVDGKLLDVIVVHVGNTQHVLDRELQALDMVQRIKAKKEIGRKTLWLGYLTDKISGPNYKRVTDAGLVDVAPGVGRYCLYIFQMGMVSSDFQRIDVEKISDTEIQKADFRFP